MAGRTRLLDLSEKAGEQKPKKAPQLWMGHMALGGQDLKDAFEADHEIYKAQFDDYEASVKNKEAQHVMARRVIFYTKSFNAASEETKKAVRDFCKEGYLKQDVVLHEVSQEYTRLEDKQT